MTLNHQRGLGYIKSTQEAVQLLPRSAGGVSCHPSAIHPPSTCHSCALALQHAPNFARKTRALYVLDIHIMATPFDSPQCPPLSACTRFYRTLILRLPLFFSTLVCVCLVNQQEVLIFDFSYSVYSTHGRHSVPTNDWPRLFFPILVLAFFLPIPFFPAHSPCDPFAAQSVPRSTSSAHLVVNDSSLRPPPHFPPLVSLSLALYTRHSSGNSNAYSCTQGSQQRRTVRLFTHFFGGN